MEKEDLSGKKSRKIINVAKAIIFVYTLQLVLSCVLYYRSIEKYEIDEIKITIEKETPWCLSIIPGAGFFLDMGDIFLDGHVNIRFQYHGWTYVTYSDSYEYIDWGNGLEVKTTDDFVFLYEKGKCEPPIIGMPRKGMRILPL